MVQPDLSFQTGGSAISLRVRAIILPRRNTVGPGHLIGDFRKADLVKRIGELENTAGITQTDTPWPRSTRCSRVSGPRHT